MNDAKLTFLFGDPSIAESYDLIVGSERDAACKDLFDEFDEFGSTVRRMIVDHVLDDDPADVWKTVERLRADGFEDNSIWTQVSTAFIHAIGSAVEDASNLVANYERTLAELPLLGVDDSTDAVLELLGGTPGMTTSEVVERVVDDTAPIDINSQLVATVIDRLSAPGRAIHATAEKRLFLVSDLLGGAVFSHAVTAAEIAADAVALSVDLAPLASVAELWAENSYPYVDLDDGELAIPLFAGALDGLDAGDVIAIRVEKDERFGVEKITEPLELDSDLAGKLRDAVEAGVTGTGMPQPIETLVLDLLATTPTVFRTPVAPLTELFDVAGLEYRDELVTHDPASWRTVDRLYRPERVDRLVGGDEDAADHVLELLEDASIVAGGESPPEKCAEARDHLLDCLADPLLMDAFTREFFVHEPPEVYHRLVDDLGGFSRAGRRRAIASYLAACAAEIEGDLAAAEQHLEIAMSADPDSPYVLTRMAWYASDRGDGRRAASLLRRVGDPEAAQAMQAVLPDAGPTLRRNDPCWCGSGRKFKQCHMGAELRSPIEERAGWLCRKAREFVEMDLGDGRDDYFAVIGFRAGGSTNHDELRRAADDPLTLDLVLEEGGWFAHFVEARGALLPDDEALLASTWMLIPRSVHEVVDLRVDEGLTLRDMRSGEVVEVTERAFTHSARIGAAYCMRVVPVGDQHQVVGGIFPVRVGREAEVLDLLDRGDPLEIANHVGQLHRPPTIVDRDGNEIDPFDPDFDPSSIMRREPMNLGDFGEDVSMEVLQLAIRERLEEQWCDEEVPALGGLTPRQAAADPTRRDSLLRLLAEFDSHGLDDEDDVITMRPDRLRELLDL